MLLERSPTRRASTFLSMSERRERDGSSGREAASAKPRCLRHPKTRPACTHPAASCRPLTAAPARPQTAAPAADRPPLNP